jgi:hypothetical protein
MQASGNGLTSKGRASDAIFEQLPRVANRVFREHAQKGKKAANGPSPGQHQTEILGVEVSTRTGHGHLHFGTVQFPLESIFGSLQKIQKSLRLCIHQIPNGSQRPSHRRVPQSKPEIINQIINYSYQNFLKCPLEEKEDLISDAEYAYQKINQLCQMAMSEKLFEKSDEVHRDWVHYSGQEEAQQQQKAGKEGEDVGVEKIHSRKLCEGHDDQHGPLQQQISPRGNRTDNSFS